MNMFKNGPEIKLSQLKVPDFLQDLYYDLKDRHLLPLVAVLLVAIVAVPFALSQSDSGQPEAESSTATAIAAQSAAANASGTLVAKSAPGLRDYRKRLDRRQAHDPFHQQYPGEEGEGSGSGEGTVTEAESSGSSAAPTELPEPSSPSPQQPSGEPGPGGLTYFSYAIDVRTVAGGAQSDAEPQVRRDLPELTMLPSRDTPAAIYMGSTRDGKKALMLISSNVEAIFGDGKCVLGSDSCQLLAMEPGVPETFVYGGEGRTYKIELLKVHLVTTDKLNRAPLGKPNKGKSKDGF
jgi:hypothetical protein